MSDMVLDNKATGSGRFWRELGGFAFSPMRGVNRLITGEAYKVHQNPPDRSPNFLQVDLKFGARTLGDQNLWTSRATKPFFAFAFLYGDPFQEIRGDPFDHFRFAMQLNFNNSPHLVGLMETEGLLFASDVNKSATSHHIISSFLHFDYIDNEAYTYGGQSLSASYLSEFKAGEHFHANTILDLQYILLGASKSDYFNLSGREYDYGPGFGFKFGAMFWIDRYEFMSISHQGRWIHSINGNKADHYVTLTRIRLDYRIRGNVGVGAEYMHYVADRRYEDYPDVHAKNPELKLHLSWKIN
jgi:hypothetical protein